MVDMLQSCLLLAILVGYITAQETGTYKRVLTVPNNVFDGKSQLWCSSQPIEAGQFFVEFEPVISHHDRIHHVSIDLCEEPYSTDRVWDCNDIHFCKPGTGHRIAVFTWGRESSGWKLPHDVGVAVGDRKKTIILQVHSANTFDANDTTETGMEITLKSSRPPKQAGLAVLGNTGRIPGNVKDYYTDSACEWRFNTTVDIMSYSIHTHGRGRAVAGYIIRDGQWIEIGRGDPKYPELAFDISHKKLSIRPGDVVANRCTYENNEERYVDFGEGAVNEMCNFYIYFSFPDIADASLKHVECSADADTFHWEDHLAGIPVDASDPSTSTDQAIYIKKYHWTKHLYRVITPA